MKSIINGKKIKNWLSIQGVRIASFVKEHKYASTVAVTLLFAGIIGFIVYATGSDDVRVLTNGLTFKQINSTEESTSAPSFSTMTYNLKYKLVSNTSSIVDNGELEIVAELKSDADVKWNLISGNGITSNYDTSNDVTNPKKIIITQQVTNVPLESSNIEMIPLSDMSLSYNIGNVLAGEEINYEIKINNITIKSNCTQEENENTSIVCSNPTTVTNSKVKKLNVKVFGGKPYEVESDTENAYIPFGLVAGIDQTLYDEIAAEEKGLEGYYFESGIDNIELAAYNISNMSETTYQDFISGTEISGEPQDVVTNPDYYGNLVKNGRFQSNYFDREDVRGLLNSGNAASNGALEYYQLPATTNCYDGVVAAIESVGPSNIKIIMLDTKASARTFEDPAAQYITKIVKEGTTEDIKSSILSGNTLTFQPAASAGILETYIVTYERKTNQNKQTVKTTRKFIIQKNENFAMEDANADLYNYGAVPSTEFSNCNTEGSNCKVYNATVLLNSNGVYEFAYEESDANRATSQENNKIYAVSYYAGGDVHSYTKYYINQTINLTKALSVSTSGNSCVATYGSDALGSTGCTTSENTHTCTKDDDEITYYTEENAATNAWKIQDMNVSIETNTVDGKLLPAGISEFNANGRTIIPVASYYTTVKTAKVAIGDSKIIGLTQINASSRDLGIVEYSLEEKITASVEAKDDSNNRLYYVSTDETLDNSRHLAYGESISFNYTLNYENTTAQTISFRINLNESNFDLKITGDSFATLPENSSIRYYVSEEESYTNIEEVLNKQIKYIDISVPNSQPAAEVNYTLDVKISDSSSSQTSMTLTYDGDKTLSVPVNVTPFKARTDVYFVNKTSDDRLSFEEKTEDNIFVNEKTETTTLLISPHVTAPGYLLNKNGSEISGFVDVKITVILPNKVHYKNNEKYTRPSSVNSETGTITYEFSEEIDKVVTHQIYFDVDYDIDIPNNTQLPIQVIIEAVDQQNINIKDISPEAERTTTRTAIYLITTDGVVAKISRSSSAILINGSFDIIVNLFNNTEEEKAGTVEVNIPTSGFDGTYTLSNMNNFTCLADGVNLQSCDAPNITTVKLNYTILPGATDNYTFTVNTSGNKEGNTYNFESTLKDSGENSSRVQLNRVSVSVTSLKIRGLVWEDFNENGIMDSTENKINDVRLILYNASNDQYVSESISNENGEYSFPNLNIGTYYVAAEFSDKYTYLESPSVSNDRTLSSSFNKINEIIRTEDIVADGSTLDLSNYNLGLVTKKVYKVSMDKTITKVEVTNALGITSTKDMGNTKLAKLDVKDMNNTKIKVIYNIEVVNSGSYPGYVYRIKDYIPAGMTFNPEYSENKGWSQVSDAYIEYKGLYDSNKVLEPGVKHNVSLALDVSTHEAGSFLNYAIIEQDDLKILGGKEDE